MKRAVFLGNQTMSIESGPEPTPGADELLVRTLRCALCGSDNRLYREGSDYTPGHEIVGVVDAPGHSLHAKRVLVYIPVFCGQCHYCQRGDAHQCQDIQALIGWQRNGGYAEALAVPERCLIPVPDDIPTDLAPLLLDTIGTAAHAIRLARRCTDGLRAAVLGAGPLGLGLVIALQRFGYQDVVCVEPSANRRGVAEELGARAVQPDQLDATFDLIFEASGNHAARTQALHQVAPFGAVVFLGESSAPYTIEPTKALRRKDFFAIRSFYFSLNEVESNLELLRADLEKYQRLVDGRFQLDELPSAFARFNNGELLKPLVQFSPAVR